MKSCHAVRCPRLARAVASIFRASLPLVGCLIPLAQTYAGDSFNNSAQVAQTARASADADAPAVLQVGKPVERELSGGQAHNYSLPLADGQVARLTVAQEGIDVIVQVFDSTSKLLAEFDTDSYENGTEHVAVVSDSAASYRLAVRAKYPKDPLAHYAILLAQLEPASHNDRLLFSARQLSAQAQAERTAAHFPAAVDLLQRAVAQAQEALGPDGAYLGELYQQLGPMLWNTGNQTKAVQVMQQAVEIDQRALGDKPQTAVALQAYGQSFIFNNDYAKAQQYLERALAILERSLGPLNPKIGDCLTALASLHQQRGDQPRAIEAAQRAQSIYEARLAPDSREVIFGLLHIGDIYIDMDDFPRAEPVLQRTLQLMQQKYGSDYYWLSEPLSDLAIIAEKRKDYATAIDYLSRTEKLREKTNGLHSTSTAGTLVMIGNLYNSEGDYPRAIDNFLRGLDIYEDIDGPYHEFTFMTLGNLARVYAAKGDTALGVNYMARMDDSAEINLALNIAVGSERERLTYANKLAYILDRTISLNVSEAPNNRTATDLAAQMILQRKGRVLDAAANSLAALRQRLSPDDQKLLDDSNAATAQLAKLTLHKPSSIAPAEYAEKIAGLQRQREHVETELSRRSAGYYQPAASVTLSAVRDAIPADSVLIEFSLYKSYDVRQTDLSEYGPPRYIAYVIPPSGSAVTRWKDLGDAKEIDAAVSAMRQAFRDPDSPNASKAARALDEKLMQPLRALGLNARHLIISPDGELNLVSFEALVDDRGHFLVESHSISYVSSGRDLLRMHGSRPSSRPPVIVANPAFGEPATPPSSSSAKPAGTLKARRSVTTGATLNSVYFAPLSGSAAEARVIKSLFPDAAVLSGPHATKAALQHLTAPEILHIATHGFFLEHEARAASAGSAAPAPDSDDLENPLLRSGLALAGANLNKDATEDGILTALEASNLDLSGTKLVTLSACDTGVGEVRSGQGVYGLRRGFVLAGTDTLLMSLWPVSDSVTRELMTDYYSALKQGVGRGDALRRAQLNMLKRPGRQHPFYWASFIQQGEWASLDGER